MNRGEKQITAKRDKEAAKRFFLKALRDAKHSTPRVINVDKALAYPPAVEELKGESVLPQNCNLRQCKYLNNIVEQDHRFIKRRVNAMLGFGSFHTGRKTLRGIEAINMIRKGQIKMVAKGDIIAQVKFIDQLFAVAA